MRILLQEWTEASDVPLRFEQVDVLRRVGEGAIEIRPGSRNGAWNLRATSYVGAIRVDDLEVFVQPKVPLENIFYMLTAGQTDIAFKGGLVGYEQHELLPALAAFYERLLADTLRRGVLKSYKEHNETLVALRGRIDIPAVLRTGGMPAPIPCRFDELSEDIPENQILRTAALALATFPDVAPSVRRNLRRTVGVLDGIRSVDPRAIPRVHLTRLNAYYESVLRMAEVILRSGGLRDRAGTLEASTFLIDMNRLFERFVTIQLRRHLAGRFEVRDQERTYLDVGRTIPMRPDLVFYRRGEPVLVADVKYKLSDDGLGRNPDYYQLLAYCSSLGLQRGLLIYGAASPDEPSSSSRVRTGEQLELGPVYLGGAQSEIRTELDHLATSLANPLRHVSSSGPHGKLA